MGGAYSLDVPARRSPDPDDTITGPIMFIRHGEKPGKSQKGVTPDGEHDDHSLSVRGWTRAGALAALFANPPFDERIVRPARLIATASAEDYRSKREYDTALPTAERLGLTIESHPIPDDFRSLVADIRRDSRATLVVWHHGSIPAFVRTFPLVNREDVPEEWPADRFDLIWSLAPVGDAYRWRELEQSLLHGDASTATSP